MGSNNQARQMVDGFLRCGSSRHVGDRMVPVVDFCKSKTPDGLSYSCKSCRTMENAQLNHARYHRWKKKDPVKAMLQGMKGNAGIKGITFNLTKDDICIPDVCPILNIPLFFSDKRTYNTPSVDRIDNTIGYEPTNIVVCSWRANMLKKDATINELHQLSQFYKILQEEKRYMTQKWEIDKSFSFCYSHRVFVQEINTKLTEHGHNKAKCRMIHGHEGMVQVFLEGEQLNEQAMVFDFVNMGFIKNFLDEVLDHRFIISRDDPQFAHIVGATIPESDNFTSLTTRNPLKSNAAHTLDVYPVVVPDTDFITGYNIDVEDLRGSEREIFESFFIVDFIPTSENLAKWLYDLVQQRLEPFGVQVSKISWNETPKSRAVYSRPS